jgi:DNA-directed RNA polymerase specialized sigma subunit
MRIIERLVFTVAVLALLAMNWYQDRAIRNLAEATINLAQASQGNSKAIQNVVKSIEILNETDQNIMRAVFQ